MALEHAGEAVLHFRRGFAGADPDGAGDVGGAVEILPAAVAQIDAVRLDPPVGFFVDLLIVGCAVLSGSRV